jgi:hypothetical protein
MCSIYVRVSEKCQRDIGNGDIEWNDVALVGTWGLLTVTRLSLKLYILGEVNGIVRSVYSIFFLLNRLESFCNWTCWTDWSSKLHVPESVKVTTIPYTV